MGFERGDTIMRGECTRSTTRVIQMMPTLFGSTLLRRYRGGKTRTFTGGQKDRIRLDIHVAEERTSTERREVWARIIPLTVTILQEGQGALAGAGVVALKEVETTVDKDAHLGMMSMIINVRILPTQIRRVTAVVSHAR